MGQPKGRRPFGLFGAMPLGTRPFGSMRISFRGVCAERPRKNDGSRRAGGADGGADHQKARNPRRISDVCPVGHSSILLFNLSGGPDAPTTVVFAGGTCRKAPHWGACPIFRRAAPSQRGVAPMGPSQRGDAPMARHRAKGATSPWRATKPQVDGAAKGATPPWHDTEPKGRHPRCMQQNTR